MANQTGPLCYRWCWGSARQLSLLQRLVVSVRFHRVRDQVLHGCVEIGCELLVQGTKLGGHRLLETGLLHPDHHGRAPLARIAVGADAVLAAQRDEDPDRPDVREGILQLDLWRVVAIRLRGELGLQPVAGRTGGRPLAFCRAAGEQRLELGECISMSLAMVSPPFFWSHQDDGAGDVKPAGHTMSLPTACWPFSNGVCPAFAHIDSSSAALTGRVRTSQRNQRPQDWRGTSRATTARQWL